MTMVATVAVGDCVQVVWPNGHGFDSFEVVQCRTHGAAAIPDMLYRGSYEYNHDGTATKVAAVTVDRRVQP